MHPKYTDVNYTLKFGREKIARTFLILGALCILIGIVGSSVGPRRSSEKYIPYVAFVIGIALTGYGLHRTFAGGKPLLVLSPSGITLDIEWVKNFTIPWHAVQSVEKVEQTVPTRGWHRTYSDVTAVAVSKAFYERNIHIDNALLRGPGWDSAFIEDGETVRVLLSYVVLPATADEIYAAVDTRWKAFRYKKPAPKGTKP